MKNLYEEFNSSDFAIFAIDIQEEKDKVARFVKSNGIKYDILLDSKATVASLYGVSSTPVKFLIDKDGNMVAAAMGYREWDSDTMKEIIQTLISQKSTS